MQSVHECALYFFAFLLAKNVRWVTFPWLTIASSGDTQWSFQVSKSVPFLEPLSLCRFSSLSSCICVHIHCLKDAIFSLHTSLLLHASKYTSINTYMHYITLHYITLHCITLHYITWRDVTLRCSYSCSCSCSCSYSYSYSCRQCVAISQIRTSFQIAGLVDGSPYPWFHFIFAPVSNIFCLFASSGTWNFYVQSGVSSFWCRALVTLVLKRRRQTLWRKVAGLFGTLGSCESLSSWFSTV